MMSDWLIEELCYEFLAACVLADFQLFSAYLSAIAVWFSFCFGAEHEIRVRQIKYGTGLAHLAGNVALNRDENMEICRDSTTVSSNLSFLFYFISCI